MPHTQLSAGISSGFSQHLVASSGRTTVKHKHKPQCQPRASGVPVGTANIVCSNQNAITL